MEIVGLNQLGTLVIRKIGLKEIQENKDVDILLWHKIFKGNSKSSAASSYTAITVQLQIFQINKNQIERSKTNMVAY